MADINQTDTVVGRTTGRSLVLGHACLLSILQRTRRSAQESDPHQGYPMLRAGCQFICRIQDAAPQTMQITRFAIADEDFTPSVWRISESLSRNITAISSGLRKARNVSLRKSRGSGQFVRNVWLAPFAVYTISQSRYIFAGGITIGPSGEGGTGGPVAQFLSQLLTGSAVVSICMVQDDKSL